MINSHLPALNIGVVANSLGVHPETLRIWEKHGLVTPKRRNKQRLYSGIDFKRLQFIHLMINDKGLNIAGVNMLVGMYPCWTSPNCSGGSIKGGAQHKPCWMEPGAYCTGYSERKIAK
jgi:DNA-binding transcriptional MerR regulator